MSPVWKKKEMPRVDAAQAAAEAARLEKVQQKKMQTWMTMAQRQAAQFRQKATSYYEAKQYAPAKIFLQLAKRLEQLQADAQLLMTVPKIRDILMGLNHTLIPMVGTEGISFEEIREKVRDIFSDEAVSFEGLDVTLTEADMRELEMNCAMSMDRSEAEAFRRMEEVMRE